MAIGLSTRKNLSESNLNLKTAIQKLYAPGIEDDITLFSLSSQIESICFSGLVDNDNAQIIKLSSERLRTISGEVLKRTRFTTKFFTFTDNNEVYFNRYTAGIGVSSDAKLPTFSELGSIPAVKTSSGGEGFYFLNNAGVSSNLCRKLGTWTASSTQFIAITLPNHGFTDGDSLVLRFNNSGGGTSANYGTYTVTSVTNPNVFTITHSSSITGGGSVLIRFFKIKINNARVRGLESAATNARADVEFTLSEPTNSSGVGATYTNTATGTSLSPTPSIDPDSSLPTVTFTKTGHGLFTGSKVYIQVLSGTAVSDYVTVTRVDTNTFTARLVSSTANSVQSCKIFRVEEITKWTPNTIERFSISSVKITDGGSNYTIPERLSLVESNVILGSNSQTLALKKQLGVFFAQKPELIKTDNFRYLVKGSSNTGFYLYDSDAQKYLFLDKNTANTGLTSAQIVELRRADNIYIENFLQFKYAQSTIYLRNYSKSLASMGSLIGEISTTSNTANFIKQRTTEAIQNTRRPIDVASSENIFGYNYNIFEGKDVVIKQRVVLRDQDYVLDFNDSSLGAGSISGNRLRDSVDRFVLGPLSSWAATASSVVTITQSSHELTTGSSVKIGDVVATTGSAFSSGQYTITVVNESSFTIALGNAITGSGTLTLITENTALQIRVPGLFLKVGNSYKRAFSTSDKPFFQATSTGVSNPALDGVNTGANYGALSAENTLSASPAITDWYSYNVTIGELAQRIHSNGRDGALYYHRSVKPTISAVAAVRNGAPGSIYSVPLFTVVE